jgi:hypothetical protein
MPVYDKPFWGIYDGEREGAGLKPSDRRAAGPTREPVEAR